MTTFKVQWEEKNYKESECFDTLEEAREYAAYFKDLPEDEEVYNISIWQEIE